jgi:maleate isomerase
MLVLSYYNLFFSIFRFFLEEFSMNQLFSRLGLLVPSSNTVLEPDLYRGLPPSCTLHTARMYLEDVTVEAEARMLDEHTLPAARQLATARPDAVVFGCTSAGALRGNAYDAELCDRISQITGVPTVSVIRAAREALRAANARRIVVVTPYIDELNQRVRTSMEEDGIEVLRIMGLGIVQNSQIALVESAEILGLAAAAVDGLTPDALFVSCTNFPAVSCLPSLRGKFPFPVITSNQAVLEAAIARLA